MAVVLVCPLRAQGCQTQSSVALLQDNLASSFPGASCCSALLCLRPTFLLRHTAPAPLLIYNPEGEGVNAEEPDKKNLICSLSLSLQFRAQYIKQRRGDFSGASCLAHLIDLIFVYRTSLSVKWKPCNEGAHFLCLNSFYYFK